LFFKAADENHASPLTNIKSKYPLHYFLPPTNLPQQKQNNQYSIKSCGQQQQYL
jgi:hypothetical protein